MTRHREGDVVSAYDLVAPFYDAWPWQAFWEANELPRVRAALAGAPGGVGLDLGAGTGRYLRALGAWGWRSIGIDASARMLEVAAQNRGQHRPSLVRADARALPLAPATVAVAVAARVLCHFADPEPVFGELARVAARGARLVVTELDPAHAFDQTSVPTPHGRVDIPTWKRDAAELERAAERVGWRTIETTQLRAADLLWLPNDRLSSIDRSSVRAIFYLVQLER